MGTRAEHSHPRLHSRNRLGRRTCSSTTPPGGWRQSQVLNCGDGHGYSVRQILETVQEVAGQKLNIRSGPRRPGDPPALVADASRIRGILGGRPAHNDLNEIVKSALRWE